MESLELPLTRKDLLPKVARDRTLFLLMNLVPVLVALFEFLAVAPTYHDSFDGVMCVNTALGLFILANIFGNLYKLRVGTGVRDAKLPAVLMPGWRYCSVCQVNAPPRSHHCNVCDECILKHDHHCMFAGRCVGFHNQRYFVMALVYILIGTLYSLVYQLEYCINNMGGAKLLFLVGQVAPHFGWLFGFYGSWGFVCSTMNLVLVLVLAFCSYLLFIQIRGILLNRTTYEQRHGIGRYDAGLWHNIYEVLGTSWYLIWLGPWVHSETLGNGLNFKNGIESVMDGHTKQL